MSRELYIGIMSGTSLDGVDAALVEFHGDAPRTVGTYYLPYPDSIRQDALALHNADNDEIHRAAMLAQELAKLYATAVVRLLDDAGVPANHVAAIGCHGQTIRHRPVDGYSIQLNAPALLAELTGISVVADFRSRDIAAGGQGAPLVPAVHQALFKSETTHRALLNLGGIGNLTNLPPQGLTAGFDCGPANILLDAWIYKHHGKTFDKDGQWASQGKPDDALLAKLQAHPFFQLPPPKSCGREEFNLAWLESNLTGQENPEDVQATLLNLTAWSAANALSRWCGKPEELFVCGGGAHNGPLMQRLQDALPCTRVASTAVLGILPDWLEAIAFAWLARQHCLRLPGNLPEVTGAKGPRILGAMYPA